MIDQFGRTSIGAPTDLPISRTDNPYWDIMRTMTGNAIEWKYEQRWSPDGFAAYDTDQYQDRRALCIQYSWAIPDPASLDFVAQHLQAGAIEIGAGTGYWAWQLSQLGVDIIAYDVAPPQLVTDNQWHSPRTETYGKLSNATRPVFFDVQPGGPEVLVVHSNRTLLLCWPPYASDMAVLCLRTYTGTRLIFIGEDDGGCTGDDDFFTLLNSDWELIETHMPVQWWGMHDYISVYERRDKNEARLL